MDTVRRRARKLVRQLRMPSPWSLVAVCQQVGALRGREVVLEPSTTITATGMVRREASRDVITYRADHHNPDHVNAHELGHLLAGHLDFADGLDATVSPDIRGAARTMQRSCSYDTDDERLAEAVADLLTASARRHTAGAHDLSTSSLIRGFGEAMR